METIDILRNLWFIIIGILFTGYSILDGFDFGAGMLMPFLAKEDRDKEAVIDSIWPVWDGNEVWLVAGAGALFAAFPLAYASVFSGFYLIFMLTLFSLIFRAVSMEFWYYDIKRRNIWSWAFTIGSFLPPLFLGIITGNIILGVPLNEQYQFTGSLLTVIRPLPVITGILVICLMILHGAVYLSLKTEGRMREKARAAAMRIWLPILIIFIISVISVFLFIPESVTSIIVWIAVILIILDLFLLRRTIKTQKDIRALILSSIVFICLWACAGAVLYPDLINGINDQNSLSIYTASSGQLTLQLMLIIAVIGMPIVIGYSIFVYRVFRGKLR